MADTRLSQIDPLWSFRSPDLPPESGRPGDHLRPPEVVQRYEREASVELLRIDIKKVGRFEDVGHRITGDYRERTRHVGWEYVFVAVDDHSRITFTDIHPNECRTRAVGFPPGSSRVQHQARRDDPARHHRRGPAFHSAAFVQACLELGMAQKFTRAYRPQTNGKAERFIQSALREWAYGRALVAINKLDRKGALGALRDVAKQVQRNRNAFGVPPSRRANLGFPKKQRRQWTCDLTTAAAFHGASEMPDGSIHRERDGPGCRYFRPPSMSRSST